MEEQESNPLTWGKKRSYELWKHYQIIPAGWFQYWNISPRETVVPTLK